jgi:hypothetical protein
MKRIHYISGLGITVFIVLHLFNHFCSLWGAEKHIEMMEILRLFYRNIGVELLLLLMLVIQIVSGISLFFVNRKTATTQFEKLHVWSGLYLAIFLLIHLTAIFVGRGVLHLDTNFYFGVAGLNSFPTNLFFVPYYALAILSFFGHIAAIHHKKMTREIAGISVENQAKAILMMGFLLTIIIFHGLTNHFQGVVIPDEYKVLI